MSVGAAAAAGEILASRDQQRLIPTFTSRDALFDTPAGYAVAAALRAMRISRGETPVGRKIGFTNRNIWPEYGVHGPIWGEVYDSTLLDVAQGDAIRISHLSQPRLEPEIVLGIDRDLEAGMSIADLEASIAWVSHGFEIVQTVFADWKFKAADCIAEGGLHGLLAVGPKRILPASARSGLSEALAKVEIDLSRDDEPVDRGVGTNVLDGPIHALKFFVEGLAAQPLAQSVRKGEVVTTGTITRAFPIKPGERWATRVAAFDLPGLDVRFA